MDPTLSRRGVMIGGTLGVLATAACASYGPEAEPSTSLPSGKVEVPAADVPVGSGAVFADQGVVVTQPTAGTYAAFTSTCTHQGCQLHDVTTTINCNCHGSQFSITDGSVANPPATQPLKEYQAELSGNKVVVTTT